PLGNRRDVSRGWLPRDARPANHELLRRFAIRRHAGRERLRRRARRREPSREQRELLAESLSAGSFYGDCVEPKASAVLAPYGPLTTRPPRCSPRPARRVGSLAG